MTVTKVKVPTKKELKENYTKMGSVKSMSNHYSVSEKTIRDWMDSKGIERRSSQPKYSFTKTELSKLYKKDSLRKIASKTGASRETIRRHLIKNGIDRR